jgi:GTP-binding protein HflX
MIDTASSFRREKVVLAALCTPEQDPVLFEEDLHEMRLLCETAGAEVVTEMVQKRDAPEASGYLGSGKLNEISSAMKRAGARTLVVDAELSAGQVRTIEKIISGKVIDRSQLILDIFAAHARTKEARIQVELAQLRTLYPRLTRAWSHFSQQVGGIGTRGPGEKQLEVDRRLIQRKITDLSRKLKKIEKSRVTQRKARKGYFNVGIVGYTNVGKSSLLNALCGTGVLVENRLFATLDTASKRAYIPGVGTIVISDTVGFLRRLPHHLVASFRSTLAAASLADLLMVVTDMSSPWRDRQLETAESVLETVGAREVPRQIVFNKADLVSDPFVQKEIAIKYPGALCVSAHDRGDMSALKQCISGRIVNFEREKSMAGIIERKTKSLAAAAGSMPEWDPSLETR